MSIADAADDESEFDDAYPISDLENLEGHLQELNNRKEISLPEFLPMKEGQMIQVLREHFKDNVTFISLVLNYFFPNKYIFYRVSKLEEEIFEGLKFLSDVITDFASLSPIGRTGFDRYLALNEALLNFGDKKWPDIDVRQLQNRLQWFLYDGVGALFWTNSNYSHYWIMGTQEQYFEELDSENEINWSGRKEMREGDLVFMYRMSPRKAITALYRVKDEPKFNPFTGWDGFWVDLEKVCDIADVTFAQMGRDPVFSQWGLVRSHFQGVVTDPIPAVVYNRLLDEIPLAVRQEHELVPEPVLEVGNSGQYTSETDFEQKVIEPLIKQWGFQYHTQHTCQFYYGGQQQSCRVDFYVTDGGRPLTLFENKLRIINEKELKAALEQGKSYALQLGLSSFVIASPESLWVYSLVRNKEKLERKFSSDRLSEHHEEIKSLLLQLR